MFRMNTIFIAIIGLVLFTLFPFKNSARSSEENSTKPLNIDYRTYSDAEINALSTESLDNSTSSEAFVSSDTVNELSGSDSPMENGTEPYNATDVFNQTDVITSIYPEAERHTNVWVHHNETLCSCDLLVDICDVNCCCDSDCTDENIGAFPLCFSTSSVPKSDYCFDSDIVFHNNTPYRKIVNEAKGLFCIVHDNFQERLKYKDVPSFSSLQQFQSLYAMDAFSWSYNFKMDKPVISQVMKAGDPLYRTASLPSTETQFRWRFPSMCFTASCECEKDVLYMEDMESSCARTFISNKEACENNSALSADTFKNFCVWSKTNPKQDAKGAMELTTLESTTEMISETEGDQGCIPLSSDQKTPTPHFDSLKADCVNVVQSVHYIVFHDGTLGITDIKLDINFRNISAGKSFFMQRFSIEFKWNSNGNNTLKRSGNPGYQIGFPVLIGTDNNNNGEHPVIKMNNGLTIIEKDSLGFCHRERKTVFFGQNVHSGCYIKGVFDNCKTFQEEIRTLLGIKEVPVFVGSFGNADPQNSAEWLKIFHEGSSENEQSEDSPCNDKLITGLIIDIAYAAVGVLTNPQHKIIGAVFRYTRMPNVHLKFVNDHYLDGLSNHLYFNTVQISTSVAFYDVSETTIPAYSRLPVLKAKLPHDFFYPFLLSSSHSNNSTAKFHIFLIYAVVVLKTITHLFVLN